MKSPSVCPTAGSYPAVRASVYEPVAPTLPDTAEFARLNVLDGESDSINSHACLICHFELHGSGLVL
jgi:hypothetical protein